ncbi:complement factor H-like isoform X3 [Ahaetulla prasina]|uniref:complement factor H-like isoform X3 n=1 Tax=Ahaetulla prasina TaxID=499056 RepID=UPI0026492585|nr:complement factor H-like isoform X3 [Ahaetulla prasina]
MKAWLLLVAVLLLWPGFSSQNACDEPDEIDFGEIVSAEKAKYLENDRVQYRCYPSYVLEGPEWIQCKGQEWTPHLPKCLERGQNCSGPPRTENGDITTLSEKQYRSGSSVEFRCQTYYALEGQKRSFCDNGTWTKVPICLDPCMIPKTELESQKIEVKDEIDAPENIFVQRGHSIELTCRTGYVLAANSSQSVFVIQCDGTPPVIPKCKEITCNSPRISNGTFRPQRTIYHDGDLVRIHCDNGFTFEPDNGEKVVECTKNGWSPPPKCIKKGCDYIQIENGRMANLYELYRPFPIAEEQSIYFYCYDGFLPANKETWQTATCIKSQYVPELKCFRIFSCRPAVNIHLHKKWLVTSSKLYPARKQQVKLSKITSNTCTISTGAPQGCVLSPLLFSLYTNDCISNDPSVKLLKFADDTTVIGLIRDNDESAYRREVERLALWCNQNNLELNTLKTVEMVVDFRKNPSILPPLTILDNTVSTVETFKFLGSIISQDLKWTANIKNIIKKGQQRMFFLRQLSKLKLPKELLIQFYRGIIESVICTSITVWFGSATQQEKHRLQRIIRTAEKIIATNLPSIEDLYTARIKKRAVKIFADSSHPGHKLFQLLPSKRRYRALHTRTTRHKNSFFPKAITLLNK